MEELSLPGFFHRCSDQAEYWEEQPPRERHQQGVPSRVEAGRRIEEFLHKVGTDPARIDVDEADGWIALGDLLKGERVHRRRLIDDIRDGVLVLQSEVIGDQFPLLASGEHAEDARGRCVVEQWEEVLDEAHPSVVGEGENLVEAFTRVYLCISAQGCSQRIRT